MFATEPHEREPSQRLPLASARMDRVLSVSMPYDYWYDRYQAYYAAGVHQTAVEHGANFRHLSLSHLPLFLRFLRKLRHSPRLTRLFNGRHDSLKLLLDRMAFVMSTPHRSPSGMFHSAVGQYVFENDDGWRRKVCIDAHDSGDISSPELLEWSDVYLKTNFWPHRNYPRCVKPMFNCNPLLLNKLERLRTMRKLIKDFDLCFIVRVWGGTDEIGGIEHVLRLIEAVSKIQCRKYIVAYLVAGDISAYAARLEQQGVRCTTSPMRLDELWNITARSRVNIIRLGMHACIPWRMADLLAMGACPVLDQDPFTTWPVALRENVNYLSLGVSTGIEANVATDDKYEHVSHMLQRMLADHALVQNIQAENARYFDNWMTPSAIGAHIYKMARSDRDDQQPTA